MSVKLKHEKIGMQMLDRGPSPYIGMSSPGIGEIERSYILLTLLMSQKSAP